MRLVVDTSVLVGELLRATGRQRLGDERLKAGIWTNDNDFLGTGVPTWTTATLQGWLDRQPPAEHDR